MLLVMNGEPAEAAATGALKAAHHFVHKTISSSYITPPSDGFATLLIN